MKKAFWISLLVAVLTVGLISAGTYALFSDSKGPTTEKLTAGTLCLDSERDDGDTVPGPMFYVTTAQGTIQPDRVGQYPTGPWAPGDTQERTLTVLNPTTCSSMNAWITSVQATLQDGSYVPMASKLMVKLHTPKNGVDAVVGEAPLSTFLAGPVAIRYPDGTKIPVVLSGNRHLHFVVTFDQAADNEFQDKTLVVDFTVNADQQAHNP